MPGFPTARFDKITTQQTPPFWVTNNHIPGVPKNYHTSPRAHTYSGVPIPYFGGDLINVDEEIAVGTIFSMTGTCKIEVENPIPERNDTPQASDDPIKSAQEDTKCVLPKLLKKK